MQEHKVTSSTDILWKFFKRRQDSVQYFRERCLIRLYKFRRKLRCTRGLIDMFMSRQTMLDFIWGEPRPIAEEHNETAIEHAEQ